LGYGDIGPFGATGYATPNIDRLAKEGRKFTRFYVSSPVCSASRAALLTGCYNARVGIHGALGPKSPVGLNPDEMTIAEVLNRKAMQHARWGSGILDGRRDFCRFIRDSMSTLEFHIQMTCGRNTRRRPKDIRRCQ
jgi:hypothetical protein